jgi:ATP-dependent exoDNAse (exonuclease V) beta subunit
VIVPGLERGTRSHQQTLIALQEFGSAEEHGGVLMAPFTPAHLADSSLYRFLNSVDAERALFETQRVLYVACTRARRALHLVATVRATSKGTASIRANTFLKLLEATLRPEVEAALENAEADLDGVPEPASEPPVLPLLRLNASLPELRFPEPDADEQDPALPNQPNREAVALGTVLHQWLELIHDHLESGWDAQRIERSAVSIRSSLRRAGAPEASLERLQERCIEALTSVVEDPKWIERLGAGSGQRSWAELPLLRREGNAFSRHAIDLLVQDESGGLHIIDFKTRAPSENDQESAARRQAQLARYSELLTKLGVGPVLDARVRVLEEVKQSD